MFLATQLFETSLNSLINETVGLLDQDELIDRAEESLLSNKMRFCTPNGKIIKPRDVITDRAIQIQSKTNELMGRLFKSGDTTYVYRGFDIRNHQNVRKDRVKLGNINANIQDTGTGNSYTPNFSIAKQFALSKFSDGVALSNHERVFNKSHYKFNFLGIDPHEFLNITNRKPVVAKYEINKKDVLFSMLSDGTKQIQDSNEIVCPFKGAKLLDYRFVN